ncbi:MAG: tRNA lysidine(34) synthetase TilS [Pseudomonadota bacterium]
MTSTPALIATIERHFGANPPDPIGVAVSGGSDSLALLHLLVDWGRTKIAAVTVDHRLRPEAADEAAFVAERCSAIGVPHSIVSWDGWDGKGNLQAEARRTRYSLLADWARAAGVGAVALGHTMDYQAETFLMRLSRRAGVDGLARMQDVFERHRQRFDRPLLGISRATLQAYLQARDISWVSDPSNEDDRFERVRAREALAYLAPLGIDAAALFDVSVNLEDASRALAHAACGFAERKVSAVAGDLVIDRTALRQLPHETRRRLLTAALCWVGSAEYPPRRDALETIDAAVGAGDSTTLHGCRILTSAMTVRITREHAAVSALALPTTALWDGRWQLEGPHRDGLEARALGEALNACGNWRDTGLPRATLLASPGVWDGETLVAAPVAGHNEGWVAKTGGMAEFAAFLISH